MGTLNILPVLLAAVLFNTLQTTAQCTPDAANCIDINKPGEICPATLPNGSLNHPYEVSFTVIPPDEFFTITQPEPLEIVKIFLKDVANLPPGLTYEANADTFFADTAYCVLVSGTPTAIGKFDLGITVIPYIYFELLGGIVEGDPVVDDTSLSITILDATYAESFSGTGQDPVRCWPNPYQVSTSVELLAPPTGPAEIIIYNLLGKKVYSEILDTRSGNLRFRFTGEELRSGTYLYTLTTGAGVYTGKLIRMQK